MEEGQGDYKVQQAKELQKEVSYRGQSHWTDNGKEEPAKIEQAGELGEWEQGKTFKPVMLLPMSNF